MRYLVRMATPVPVLDRAVRVTCSPLADDARRSRTARSSLMKRAVFVDGDRPNHFVEESARFPRNDRVSTISRYVLCLNETACDSVKWSINSTKQAVFTYRLGSKNPVEGLVVAIPCRFDSCLGQLVTLKRVTLPDDVRQCSQIT